MDAGQHNGASDMSPGLAEVIGRALIDDAFRESLYTNRRAAVANMRLSAADEEALDSIPRDTMEQHAARFSQGSASAVTISIAIKGTFDTA